MSNQEIVKYFYETVISQSLLDEVSDYVSGVCEVCIGGNRFPVGIDGMKQHIIDTKKTYPDYSMKIIRQFCDGDYVISEFIMEGTHAGDWLGMKPTNKKLTFTGVDIDKLIDGKIVEHGGAVNTFDTLFAEGILVPAP